MCGHAVMSEQETPCPWEPRDQQLPAPWSPVVSALWSLQVPAPIPGHPILSTRSEPPPSSAGRLYYALSP